MALAFLWGLVVSFVMGWDVWVMMIVHIGSTSLSRYSLGRRLVASERRCVEFRRHDILWFSLVRGKVVVSANRYVDFSYRDIPCASCIGYLWRNMYSWSCSASHSSAPPCVWVAWSAADVFGSSSLGHHGTSERMQGQRYGIMVHEYSCCLLECNKDEPGQRLCAGERGCC